MVRKNKAYFEIAIEITENKKTSFCRLHNKVYAKQKRGFLFYLSQQLGFSVARHNQLERFIFAVGFWTVISAVLLDIFGKIGMFSGLNLSY